MSPARRRAAATIAYYAGAVTILFALFSAMHGALTLIEERRRGSPTGILAGRSGMAPVVTGKFLFLGAQAVVQAAAIFATAQLVYGVEVTAAPGPLACDHGWRRRSARPASRSGLWPFAAPASRRRCSRPS